MSQIYTGEELNKIAISIQIDTNGKPIHFPVVEMEKALSVWKKVQSAIDGDVFIEKDIDFSAEEKIFISGMVRNRNWDIISAQSVVTLLEKLK